MNSRSPLEEAFPASSLSPELRERISRLALQRRPSIWRRRLPALAFGAVTLLLAAILIVPRTASAHSLARIEAAFDGVPSYTMTTYLVGDDGNPKVSSVMSASGGRSRQVKGNEIEFIEPDGIYNYKPAAHLVVHYKNTRQGKAMESLHDLLEELRSSNWVHGIQIDENANFEGRRAIEVSFQLQTEPSRVRVYADQFSSLPFRGEIDWRLPDGGWRLERIMEINYETPVDAESLVARFPAGTQVLDNEQLKAEWEKRLGKGILTIDKEGAHVVIRDAVVLSNGDVMILYTNGMKHISFSKFPSGTVRASNVPTPQIGRVTDEFGREYIKVDSDIQGTMYTTADEFVGGYRFNGEDLLAVAFTPIDEGKPAQKAILGFYDGLSKDITVDLRLGGDLPEWAELIGGGPRHAMEEAAQSALARANYWIQRDPAQAQHDVLEAIQLNDQWTSEVGEQMTQGNSYELLGNALRLQGKKTEARQAYERAIKDDPEGREGYERLIKLLGN